LFLRFNTNNFNDLVSQSASHSVISHSIVLDSITNMAISEIERYPDGASPEYIQAREDLLAQESALRHQIEKVAALRRQLPPGAVMKEYLFDGPNNSKVSLKDLTKDGRNLVVYHLMFHTDKEEHPCSMCGLFVDSQNGVGKHLKQLVNYVVVCKAPYPHIAAYAQKRGWNDLTFLSSANCDFNKDMKVEYPAWAPNDSDVPGVSVFKQDDEGNVRHVYSATAHFEVGSERGMDLLSPLYNILDLTPEVRIL
jgi:predicted dithiol-disulfide oxidoreductase (DUF899 family)